MFHYVLHRVIVNLRERQDLTQKAVALRGDVDPALVSKWESGERRPEDYRLATLCEGLGCTEIALWNEHTRLQEVYYREQAKLLGERAPDVSGSPVVREIQELLAHRYTEDVPPEVGEAFRELRATLVTQLSLVEPLVEQYRRLHRVIRDSVSRP